MNTFKISIALFSALTSLSICCAQNELKQFNINQNEFLTGKTFKTLITEQFDFEKKYFLVEIKTTDNKTHYYDAHNFNIYHFGQYKKDRITKEYPVQNRYSKPITSANLRLEPIDENNTDEQESNENIKIQLIDRQYDLPIKQIKYYVYTKNKFTLIKNITWEDFYKNYPNPTFHLKLALNYLNFEITRELAKPYLILATRQNSNPKIRSYALENLINLFPNDRSEIKKTLKSINLDELEPDAQAIANLFLLNQNEFENEQDRTQIITRLNNVYKKDASGHLKEQIKSATDHIKQINNRLKLAISYFKDSQNTKAIEYLEPILKNLHDENIKRYLDNQSQMKTYCEACYYYAKYKFENNEVDKSIEYFETSLFGTEFVKALSHYYLGKIFATQYTANINEVLYTNAKHHLNKVLKSSLLNNDLRIEANKLLQTIENVLLRRSSTNLSGRFKEVNKDQSSKINKENEQAQTLIKRHQSIKPYREDIDDVNTRKCPCDNCNIQ